MQLFSQQLAECCEHSEQKIVIYLEGDLGTGKTTLARGFIQYFGFDKVKSPTYSLVESYQNKRISIQHFDCYRLANPEELETIGIRDYANSKIQLIEWAKLGKGALATADMTIKITGINQQRTLSINAHSTAGNTIKQCIKS